MPNAKTGKTGVHFKPTPFDLAVNPHGNFSVPCGKCIGCQSDRRRDWRNRMMFELSLHDCGTFVTLTYRDAPPSPLKKDVQDFLKRLRNAERDYDVPVPKPLRYFFCGERGSKRGRPHYHGLLFGLDMMRDEWQPYISTFNREGFPVYSSKVLERIWPYGFNVIGKIDYCTIRYVSKYIVKCVGQEDSFTLKSIGLGSDFFFNRQRAGRKFERWYRSDARVLLSKGIVHLPFRGDVLSVPIPRAFDRYIDSFAPDDLEHLKLLRRQYAINSSVDIAARAAYLQEKNKYKPNERRLDYDDEESIFHP